MLRNALFLLSSLFLILSSCKKEELSFLLEGTVTDGTFNTPLANTEVTIYTFELGGAQGNVVTTLTTDSQGSFSYELPRDKYEKIEIFIGKENYFSYLDVIPFSDLSTEETNTFNYVVNAKAWTRFIIKNQQPLQSDEFKILKDSGKEDCADCCPNGYTYYYGAADTVVVCPNDANNYMKFYYWVNGNESNGVDSVYNTPFDTTTYDFYY
jgi:hypothetical protein